MWAMTATVPDNPRFLCPCRCFFSREIYTFGLTLSPISKHTLTLLLSATDVSIAERVKQVAEAEILLFLSLTANGLRFLHSTLILVATLATESENTIERCSITQEALFSRIQCSCCKLAYSSYRNEHKRFISSAR